MGGSGGGKMQYASVFCSEKGLTFQVYGVGRQSRATVDISAGLFSEFYVAEHRVIVEDDDCDNHDPTTSSSTNGTSTSNGGKGQVEVIKGGEFGINLSTVLGCLLVLGPSSLDRTTLCLSYDASEAIFKIELLEEAGLVSRGGVILSNCAIPGMSVEDDVHDNEDDDDDDDDENEEAQGHQRSGLDYAFRSEPIVARARIQSEFLRGAMAELTDVAGAVSVTVGISKKCLELSTSGHSTECHIVIPYAGNHPEFFVSLEVLGGKGGDGGKGDVHARSYPIQFILSGMRGLEIARETCISMNANGMIAIQHQIVDKIGNGDPSYVDFIMGCLQEDYDVEQDEQSQEIDYGEDDEDDYEHVSNPTTFGSSRQLQISTIQNAHREGMDNDEEEENSFQSSNHSNTKINALGRNNTRQDTVIDADEEKEWDSQRSLSQQLFGNSAGFAIPRRHDVSAGRNTRRKLNNVPNESESIESKVDEQIMDASSHGSETDFEDSIDVTATLNASRRRRSEGWTDSQSISSPQLMYGDTHLEQSDDEK